jgi:enterochelin esterase-like enzyme
VSDRKSRAMAGLSAGGGATFNVGLKHTELFSQFGFFSSGAMTAEAASTSSIMPSCGCATTSTES